MIVSRAPLLTLALLVALASTSFEQTIVPSNAQLLSLIAAVEADKVDSRSRYNNAIELSKLIEIATKSHREVIDRKVIEGVADLLKLPDVRGFAAASLFDIGPRARSAIPALKQALRAELKWEDTPVDSSGTVLWKDGSAVDPICSALTRLSGKVPAVCDARWRQLFRGR